MVASSEVNRFELQQRKGKYTLKWEQFIKWEHSIKWEQFIKWEIYLDRA